MRSQSMCYVEIVNSNGDRYVRSVSMSQADAEEQARRWRWCYSLECGRFGWSVVVREE
jgi:hypothetical protein